MPIEKNKPSSGVRGLGIAKTSSLSPFVEAIHA